MNILADRSSFHLGRASRGTGNIEAAQLNGDVVMLGHLLGIPTPYNELLWHTADRMAVSGEKPGKYTADELTRAVQQGTPA